MNDPLKENEAAPSGNKPGLTRTISIYLLVAFAVIIAIGLLGIRSLSEISKLATSTRDEIMPAILDRQRTIVNLEKMERFAESIYRSDDQVIRRRYKLAAHLLSQDAIFENDKALSLNVLDAYREIENLVSLREQQEQLQIQSDEALLELMSLRGNLDASVSTLLISASNAHTLAELRNIRYKFEKLTDSSFLTKEETLQADLLFSSKWDSFELDRQTARRWANIQETLHKVSTNLSAKAAVTANDRFTLIAHEADMATRNGQLAAAALFFVIIMLVFFLQRDIAVPILRYVQRLGQMGTSDEQQQPLPEARIKELDAIRTAVENSINLMSQLAARTEELEDVNANLESEIEIRKAAQRELARAKQQAESADRAKSEFLAGMSHEIRTPMNTMLGMGDLILETNPNPTQRKYIEIFQSSGEMLLEIINDVLDISKIESGQIALEMVPFELNEFLIRTRRVVAGRATQKGLDFALDIGNDVPDVLIGDPTRLRQVLVNLIDNGVKFTERGEVRLAIQRADVLNPGRLTFAVIDTGIGIPESALDQVFKPFTQADASTTRRFGGTGLGLAICRQLVEIMGGTLSVESHIGQGSVFHFTLNLEVGTAQSIPTHSSRRTNAIQPQIDMLEDIPHSILVAEDSESNQALIDLYFKQTACDIDFASDGSDAVALYNEKKYDLILMDIQMPTMDGYEATRRIRAMEAEKGVPPVPIIAVTANAFKEDLDKSLEAGCTDYLAKPVSKQSLLECVAKHVKRGI